MPSNPAPVMACLSLQAAHKHASAAISLVLSAERGTCFTLMSQEIDALGQLLDPVKVDWVTGGALVTPPGTVC